MLDTKVRFYKKIHIGYDSLYLINNYKNHNHIATELFNYVI